MNIVEIALIHLRAHPLNSNVMEERLLAKLTDHVARTGRYPPVIVRALPDEGAQQMFQILDGHHRVEALRRTGAKAARCVVWEVDDDEAMLLLATLNRLQGQDDPHKRAKLIAQLADGRGENLSRLALELPERAGQLEALAALTQAPQQRPPRNVDDLPVPVHFFLSRDERSELEGKLRRIGGTREQALMACVKASGPCAT